jgi:phosphatidylinositol 3-kinase
MGGPDSQEYKAFLSFCLQAYRVLRKSASLVLTLIRLMRDAGIKDLSTDPETVLMKVHLVFCVLRGGVCCCHRLSTRLQLQDNFRLEISDEEAEYFFLDMIEQSVTAFFPVMAEIIHSIAVSLRR